MLIGFHRHWWRGVPLREGRPSVGHTALPSTVFEVARMRDHMLAERYAWRDGRAAIRQAWLELKEMVVPARLDPTEPQAIHDALERTVFILPSMQGMCARWSSCYVDLRRCCSSCVAWPSS